MYNEIGEKVLEFIKRYKYKSLKWRVVKRYLSFFVLYLKETLLPTFKRSDYTKYRLWLVNLKNENGYDFSVTWITGNLEAVHQFFKWLNKTGYVKKNPLPEFIYETEKKKIKKLQFLKIQALQRRYLNRLSDDKVKTFYFDFILRYSKSFKDYLKMSFIFFFDKSTEHQKSILQLKEADIRIFLKESYDYEFENVTLVRKETLRHLIKGMKKFYLYCYEQGFTSDLKLENWNDEVIIKEIEQAERKGVKARRYTLKEILRAYKKYLQKKHSYFTDIEEKYKGIKLFIKFLGSIGKNVYSFDEEVFEKYKEYLKNYEYIIGVKYKVSFQLTRIRIVKAFYDWFVRKRYIESHPIINFDFKSYEVTLLKHEKTRRSRHIRIVPESFRELFKEFIGYVNTLGYSSKTTIHYERGLQIFFYYLESVQITDIKEVNEEILSLYSIYLKEWQDETGKGYSNNTRGRYLCYVKKFFFYLLKVKFIEKDPSVFIELPKCQRGLPTTGLKDQEIKQLISFVDTCSLKGIRDMALLLTLYTTGARSNEVKHLKMSDIDYVRGLVRFNETKGGKDFQRIVAIGNTALEWIQKYLKEVRKYLLKGEDHGYIFLGMNGKHINKGSILSMVKSYMVKAGLKKNVVTHSFRVSCGTEMLRGGADLKYIQQQLGHICINSTERYMRLVPGDLKKIHSKTHPEEKRRSGTA